MTSPRAALSFAALVAAALVLDAADYARLRWQAYRPASKRPQCGTAPHAAYERPCAAWCAGASHS